MREYNIGGVKAEYKLIPNDSHKSFYGKARVMDFTSGAKVLYSYNTPVIVELPDGKMFDLWGGWSATTGRHIRAFCGLGKKQVLELPLAVKFKLGSDEYIRERE